MKYLSIALLAAVLLFGGAAVSTAGEYHASGTLLCYDCHTMHFSMQHDFAGGTSISTTPVTGGGWLSANGPNAYLLKDEVNYLCLACHDGQTIAPDVLETNTNAGSYADGGRSAGGLNRAGTGPYETWKGHTLDSTDDPPGLGTGTYTGPLECTSCHTQHGRAEAYRNLGPRSIATSNLSYVIGTTNDSTKHVWINIAAPYTAGTGLPGTFGPYYSSANIFYNSITGTAANGAAYSNGISSVCSNCHRNFHGQPGSSGIGGSASGSFIRHPTAGITIGTLGGGHSNLGRYTTATTKVKVAANYTDATTFSNPIPICQSCHKSHGNQNPFGLVFLSRNAATVTEEGGFAAADPDTTTGTGLRNLCGQCHVQGN